MKKNMPLWVMVTFLLVPGLCLAQAPHQVGGFILGSDIADYREIVNMNTSMPIRYMECLKEVETKNVEGFKSGLLSYGTCDKPGRIVRIKLKYTDPSKKFYDTLLRHFKKRFGEPSEWRGDSFQVIIAWKWSFTDESNNRISMILQHNTMDEEQKMGNSIKLTMTNLVMKERHCFEKMHPEFRKKSKKQDQKTGSNIDWDRFVPR